MAGGAHKLQASLVGGPVLLVLKLRAVILLAFEFSPSFPQAFAKNSSFFHLFGHPVHQDSDLPEIE